MTDLNQLIDVWDQGHRELAGALSDFPVDDLWKRPNPRLLSAGELGGHIALAQALWILGNGDFKIDLNQLAISSPLFISAIRYYPHTLETQIELDLTPEQLMAEVMRVHEAAKSVIQDKNDNDAYPGQWGTWGKMLSYQVFHVAYHTGQIYTVRHLLGV